MDSSYKKTFNNGKNYIQYTRSLMISIYNHHLLIVITV